MTSTRIDDGHDGDTAVLADAMAYSPPTTRMAVLRAGRLLRWALAPRAIVERTRRRRARDANPDDDVLTPTPPTRTLIIAALPRTGSSLLGDRLEASGVAGLPGEYFSEVVMCRMARQVGIPVLTARARRRQFARRLRLNRYWESVPDFEPGTVRDHLRSVVERRTGSNGVFSVKLHWPHLEALERVHEIRIDEFPQPIDWIWMTREDVLAQAVSRVRGLQTNVWNSADRATYRLEPERYDAVEIRRSIAGVLQGEDAWRRYFDERGISPVRVDYEELSADPDGVTARVLGELGLRADDAPVVAATTMRRQADDTTRDWIDRFRREFPDLVGALDRRRAERGGSLIERSDATASTSSGARCS